MSTLGMLFTLSAPLPNLPAIYAVVTRVSDGQVWNRDAEAFEAQNAQHWSQYVFELELIRDTVWKLEIPYADLPAGGTYLFQFLQPEAIDEEPAIDDLLLTTKTESNWGRKLDPPTDFPMDHNTGGVDAMRVVVTGTDEGIDGVVIRSYLTSEYTADASTATLRGQSETKADGRWKAPIYRNPTIDYTLTFRTPDGQTTVIEMPAVEGDS
jgi:hypothetical protein